MTHERGPVAAIDIGTNTALLLVAESDAGGRLVTLEECATTPRLGSGLAARGSLDPAAVERTLEVLREFAARIRERGLPLRRVRAVGTAVLRRASDARTFVDRVRRETGLAIEIASEDEEARLGTLALRSLGIGDDALVIDVGGGSSEIACDALGLRRSIPIGAVVLHETWLADRPLQSGGWPALSAAVARAVESFPVAIARGRAVWAIGGTAVNVACLDGAFARFDPARAEGRTLRAECVARWAEELHAASPSERRARPIEPARAEILPAGLAILAAVLARIGAESFSVSSRGLRHGIALDLLRAESARRGDADPTNPANVG